MHIKIVKKYSEQYCELVVTDNSRDVICICDVVPLYNEKIIGGMKIKMLNAFFSDEKNKIASINDVKKQNYKLSKVGICGMSYSLRGKIVDANRYIVKVYDFYISLEYLFSSEYMEPQNFSYKDGEWIEFIVDRFDAVI